jgi:rhomboid protease GluP
VPDHRDPPQRPPSLEVGVSEIQDGDAPGGASPAPPVVLRFARDSDQADEWTLVLTAIGVPSRVVPASTLGGAGDDRAGFALLVDAARAPAAARALAAYERESRESLDERPLPAPERGSGALGLVVGALLAAFQRVTGLADSADDTRWVAAGVADAGRIRAGEWWRAITAMTLHADVMHLLGNIVASAIFVGAAGRWLGWGVAALLMVLAAGAANVATAFTQPADHQSIGASTVTFAALGLLVGLQVVHRWRGGGLLRRRSWLGFGAGLGLLAMLGMGQKADVSAHAFSIGFGAVLGLGAGALMDRRPDAGDPPPPGPPFQGSSPAERHRGARRWAQRALALVVLGAVAAAWRRAVN